MQSTTSDRGKNISWMHRFATLVSVVTFLLIVMGALVSASNSTLVAPQWNGPVGNPLFFTDPPLKYGFAYWLTAAGTSLLTFLLAFWLWKSKVERHLKILAGLAAGALIVDIILGYIPILGRLSINHSLANDCGIQILFCLAVCLALFTRNDWRWDHAKTPDIVSPSLRQILIFTTGAVFLQAVLGEGASQGKVRIAPHLVLGIIITSCAFWVLEMALTKFAHTPELRIPVILFAELVGLELFLGIITYSMRLNAQAASVSQPGVAVMQVTHAAVGELVLAASLFVTFQAFKYLASEERVIATVPFQETQQVSSPDSY